MDTFPHKLVPMMRRAVTLLALACALALGTPVIAAAASGGTASQAISDCNDHGTLTKTYSSSTLRSALAQMPGDVKEYTDCYDVIERQLFKQLGSAAPGTATTGSSSGSSFLPTWLIIVIVVLALAAITFGAMAIRRRSGPGGPGGPGAGGPDGPGAGGPPPPSGPSDPGNPGGPPAT
jgi:hypothetical protein